MFHMLKKKKYILPMFQNITKIWIVLILLQKKTKLEPHKKVENKNDFNIMLPSEDTKKLEFKQYKISDEPPFIIYADLKSFI